MPLSMLPQVLLGGLLMSLPHNNVSTVILDRFRRESIVFHREYRQTRPPDETASFVNESLVFSSYLLCNVGHCKPKPMGYGNGTNGLAEFLAISLFHSRMLVEG